MYTDVTESANSPGDIEPLFGTPTIAGDTLSWSSPSFAATAASGRIDPTSATLEFDLAASSGQGTDDDR